jgi:hypothetical protein
MRRMDIEYISRHEGARRYARKENNGNETRK